MTDIEFLSKKFQDIDVQLIFDENGELHLPYETVGKALNYSRPKHEVEAIIENHLDVFKDKIKEFPRLVEPTPIKALTRKGLDLLLMYTRKKEADPFKLWVADVLDERRKELNPFRNPLEQRRWMAQQLVTILDEQIAMGERMDFLEYRQHEFIDGFKERLPPQTIRFHRTKKPGIIKGILREIKEAILKKYPNYRSPVASPSAQDSERMAWGFAYGIFKSQFDCTVEDLLVEDWNRAIFLLTCLRDKIRTGELDPRVWFTPEKIESLCNFQKGEQRPFDLTNYKINEKEDRA